MSNRNDLYQPPVLTVEQAYEEWKRDQQRGSIPERGADSILFSRFTTEMRRKACIVLPDTLLRLDVMTFGGADGGTGVMRHGVQGEAFDQAAELSGGRYSVEAFSLDAYLAELMNRLRSLFPAYLLEAQPDEGGTLVHAERKLITRVREEIERRPYLSSHISQAVELPDARVRDMKDRMASA